MTREIEARFYEWSIDGPSLMMIAKKRHFHRQVASIDILYHLCLFAVARNSNLRNGKIGRQRNFHCDNNQFLTF